METSRRKNNSHNINSNTYNNPNNSNNRSDKYTKTEENNNVNSNTIYIDNHDNNNDIDTAQLKSNKHTFFDRLKLKRQTKVITALNENWNNYSKLEKLLSLGVDAFNINSEISFYTKKEIISKIKYLSLESTQCIPIIYNISYYRMYINQVKETDEREYNVSKGEYVFILKKKDILEHSKVLECSCLPSTRYSLKNFPFLNLNNYCCGTHKDYTNINLMNSNSNSKLNTVLTTIPEVICSTVVDNNLPSASNNKIDNDVNYSNNNYIDIVNYDTATPQTNNIINEENKNIDDDNNALKDSNKKVEIKKETKEINELNYFNDSNSPTNNINNNINNNSNINNSNDNKINNMFNNISNSHPQKHKLIDIAKRLHTLPSEKIQRENQVITISTQPDLNFNLCKVGNVFFINNNDVTLDVIEVHDKYLKCKVNNSGTIYKHSSFSIFHENHFKNNLIKEDQYLLVKEIEEAIALGVDYIVISIIRDSREEIQQIKELLKFKKAEHIRIIVNLNSQESIAWFDEFSELVDAIYFSRNDMLLKDDLSKICYNQRQIISKCSYNSKLIK